MPAVHEAIESFREDATHNNAVGMVLAALTAANERIEAPADGRRGYYFEFGRGQWTSRDSKAIFWPGSGLTYVGTMTLAQQNELDQLIRSFVDAAARQSYAESLAKPLHVVANPGPVDSAGGAPD